MKITGTSEMARMQVMQRRAITTRNALDRAAVEMSTGEKASRFKATGGNLTRLFSLERSIDRNAVYSETISLTELRLDVMQAGLGLILGPAESLMVDLGSAVGAGDIAAARMHAATARRDFTAAVGMLNTQVAGQSLFAGTATDGPALAAAEAMLADLDALAAGAADAAAAIVAIDAYFTPPGGGFFATGYVGSTTDLTPVEIGEGQRLDFGLRADAPELVALMRSQALAAVVDGGAFAGNATEQLALLAEAGSGMLSAKEGILALRTQVGIDQEAVERARAERIAERDVLEIARAKIVAVDPLEAASTFQMLESQLQSVYTVTARLANLRFFNFMPR
jgi:flagellar hook-associated protein 3 FlgL